VLNNVTLDVTFCGGMLQFIFLIIILNTKPQWSS